VCVCVCECVPKRSLHMFVEHARWRFPKPVSMVISHSQFSSALTFENFCLARTHQKSAFRCCSRVWGQNFSKAIPVVMVLGQFVLSQLIESIFSMRVRGTIFTSHLYSHCTRSICTQSVYWIYFVYARARYNFWKAICMSQVPRFQTTLVNVLSPLRSAQTSEQCYSRSVRVGFLKLQVSLQKSPIKETVFCKRDI